VYVAPDSGLTNTFGFLNSGRYFEMLSSSRKWPSSYSIITATLVMGLVIEQIRKIVSGRIPLLASRSIIPCGLNHTTRPRRATSVTAPAIRLSSMLFCTVAPIRSSRSADMPTVSGFAAGSSCATAAVATSAHIALKMQSSAQAPILLRTGFRDLLATKSRVLPESEELALLGNEVWVLLRAQKYFSRCIISWPPLSVLPFVASDCTPPKALAHPFPVNQEPDASHHCQLPPSLPDSTNSASASSSRSHTHAPSSAGRNSFACGSFTSLLPHLLTSSLATPYFPVVHSTYQIYASLCKDSSMTTPAHSVPSSNLARSARSDVIVATHKKYLWSSNTNYYEQLLVADRG